MTNAGDFLQRKFLHKDDIPNPTVLTIAGHSETDIDSEMRLVVHFVEQGYKPCLLNKTNTRTLINLFGQTVESWYGKRAEFFNDTSVQFQGQIGGIRIRQAESAEDLRAKLAAMESDPAPQPAKEDDMPW